MEAEYTAQDLACGDYVPSIFYNNGVPIGLQILRNSEILAMVEDNPNAVNNLKEMMCSASYVLEAGQSIHCQSYYSKAGLDNRHIISGTIQYLE